MRIRSLSKPAILVITTVGIGLALAAWKSNSLANAADAAASQPEPMESVSSALAEERDHLRSTTSIGTVVALRSITVRNELPGTVRHVRLTPGSVVEAGTVLVGLDVSVETAELQALEAQAKLAATQLERVQRMVERKAASQMELDGARAQFDVANAQTARTRAVIARKTIRAPFRARVGISDVHEGQYLNEGTELTTLQGVDDSTYVDFTVSQSVAAGLRKGVPVGVYSEVDGKRVTANIMALDSRVDTNTRNTVVRASIADASQAPSPGASVRVEVPVGTARKVVVVPASALRKGPGGDHVFVLTEDESGQTRAYQRTVTVEALRGDEVVISSGIKAGERVAASGAFKLREAALVALAQPVESPGAGGAAAGGK
ncbi:MAG TPA: efflux RND transporter periplasmic adaptor subunit [Steroidobacteraceae bacterium]|nr:efflux RND transporter periplasmic adaptor subunit [Steroidobacteraceae bacterium]